MRRFKGLLAFLITAAVACASSACAAGPATPNLLRVAHRVTWAADWAADSYGWLSDHELLFFHAAGKVLKPIRLDVTDGRQTLLPFMDAGWAEFAKDYQKSGDAVTSGFTASLSPDGRRLFWTVHAFDSVAVYAADVDGAHQFHFFYSGDSQPPEYLWLGDSQELVSFHSDAGGLHAKTLRLDKSELSLDADASPAGVVGTFGPRGPVLVTPDRCILSDDWNPGGPSTPTIHVMQATFTPLVPRGRITRTATITLPAAGRTVLGIDYSPQGNRIAWTLQHPGARAALWVCRIDGTGWREIGELPQSKAHGPDEDLTSVRWLPSGRGISFLCHRSLWTVTVPER